VIDKEFGPTFSVPYLILHHLATKSIHAGMFDRKGFE